MTELLAYGKGCKFDCPPPLDGEAMAVGLAVVFGVPFIVGVLLWVMCR